MTHDKFFYKIMLIAIASAVTIITACGGDGSNQKQPIETAGDARKPKIVVDPSGNATVVWQQFDGTRWNIWANRYTTGSGWGTAQQIGTGNVNLMLAVDSSGNVMLVWMQSDGTRYNISANRYTAGSGWGTAQFIETSDEVVSEPQLAIDSSGNAAVVWQQYNGTRHNIWANRYTAGSNWGTAQLIESDNVGSAYLPQLVIDSSGNITVVWHQSDGTRDNIWANRYTAGSNWGTAQLIESDNAGDASRPQLAIDSSGNVTVVWEQSDGTRYNVWANRYTAGSGWGTAQLIETDNSGNAEGLQLTADSSGNITVVWLQTDGMQPMYIWANRYTAGSNWGTAQLIESDAGPAGYPQLAIDSSGNVTVVWQQYDWTSYNIRANRYTAGSGWGTAQYISDNAGNANDPQFAIDSSGNVTVVWAQDDGTSYNICANHYTAGSGWGTAQLIESDAGPAGYPQLAIDSSGNVTVVWEQSDGTRYNIITRRYE